VNCKSAKTARSRIIAQQKADHLPKTDGPYFVCEKEWTYSGASHHRIALGLGLGFGIPTLIIIWFLGCCFLSASKRGAYKKRKTINIYRDFFKVQSARFKPHEKGWKERQEAVVVLREASHQVSETLPEGKSEETLTSRTILGKIADECDDVALDLCVFRTHEHEHEHTQPQPWEKQGETERSSGDRESPSVANVEGNIEDAPPRYEWHETSGRSR